MGAERASDTRRREQGKACCECRLTLDVPPWGHWGERRCDRCQAALDERLRIAAFNAPRHRVLVTFHCRNGVWLLTFLEADCKTTAGPQRRFRTAQSIVEIARRGHADLDTGDLCALRNGTLHQQIEQGRGTVWLNLTADQYRRLK